ncbi:MAG: HAMP domain-containing sensor histidine kinase [Pseudomonadota bacterium]
MTKDPCQSKKTADPSGLAIERATAAMAHDVLTPLRNISALSGVMKADLTASPEKVVEFFDVMERSASKAAARVEALIDYLSLDVLDPMVAVDLGEAVSAAYDALDSERKKRLLLRIDGSGRCLGDPGLLEKAFSELLRNAADFGILPQSEDDQSVVEVDISFRSDNDAIVVAVSDNGPGIAAPHQALKLFQKRHADEDAPGLGIGLPLAQKIFELHGGSLAFSDDSVERRGVCLTLTLPSL